LGVPAIDNGVVLHWQLRALCFHLLLSSVSVVKSQMNLNAGIVLNYPA